MGKIGSKGMMMFLSFLITVSQIPDATLATSNNASQNAADTAVDIAPAALARHVDEWNQAAGAGELDVRHSDYYRLVNDHLLKNYQRHLRPVFSHRTVTNISVYINVIALQEVNEAFQTMRHSSWLHMEWTDEFLSWDPRRHSNITSIDIPEDKIWLPTVCVVNSMQGTGVLTLPNAGSALAEHTGRVVWVPAGSKETRCSLDVTFFPFDAQKCFMEVDLWTLHENQARLIVKDVYTCSDFVENSEWKLTELTAEIIPSDFQGQNFSKLFVYFHLERRRLLPTLTMVAPNVLLALLSGLVFLLPFEGGEKMSFSMALLLAFAVNLSVLVTEMPRSSLQVSYFAIYLTSLSVVTALCVMTTVCLLNLYRKVEVVGSKVTTLVLFLRKLVHVKRRCPDTVASNDVVDRHDLQSLCGINANDGNCDVPVTYTPNTDGPFHQTQTLPGMCGCRKNDPNMAKKRLSDAGVHASEPADTESVDLNWKEVAVTLDHVFFRLFVSTIVVMTVLLAVALFKGQSS